MRGTATTSVHKVRAQHKALQVGPRGSAAGDPTAGFVSTCHSCRPWWSVCRDKWDLGTRRGRRVFWAALVGLPSRLCAAQSASSVMPQQDGMTTCGPHGLEDGSLHKCARLPSRAREVAFLFARRLHLFETMYPALLYVPRLTDPRCPGLHHRVRTETWTCPGERSDGPGSECVRTEPGPAWLCPLTRLSLVPVPTAHGAKSNLLYQV